MSQGIVHELQWTDQDGDRVRFSWDDVEQVGTGGLTQGCLQVFDGETGHESAVYVDRADAERLIAWLTERLADA